MHFGRHLRDGNISRSDLGFPFFLFNSLRPNFPLFLGIILFYVRRDCLLLGLEEGLGPTLRCSKESIPEAPTSILAHFLLYRVRFGAIAQI